MAIKPAIHYKKDAFDTSSRRLLGRQVASEGFLKALVQHGQAEHIYCFADHQAEFLEFCDLVRPWLIKDRQATWIPSVEPGYQMDAQVLYRGDLNISDMVWQRRFTNERAYSLCGITHTISSKRAMEFIGDLAIAPTQPWDAIVCTSVSVKTAFEKIMDNWLAYLGERFNCEPQIQFQLPVIPLGVDCSLFPHPKQRENNRSALRQAYGIPQDEIALLFVGRLIPTAKAHPVPLFLSLEKAAQALAQKLTLVLMGWFENKNDEQAFKEAIQKFCPSIRVLYIDGRNEKNRFSVWPIADIFVSLSDNIQETFGLTPVEAMANGLPVIVSDWDGYKETVRHGIDGFRIPTLMVPSGNGEDLAYAYLGDLFPYSQFVGNVALSTVIDIEACTQAIMTLCQDTELRRQMGENGRNQVENVFEWKVIIKAYEQLWEELAEIREAARPIALRKLDSPAYPLCDDPFTIYSHYPTALLEGNQLLSRGNNTSKARLNQLHDDTMVNPKWFKGAPNFAVPRVLNCLKAENAVTVDELVQSLKAETPQQKASLFRTLAQLLKFDIVSLK